MMALYYEGKEWNSPNPKISITKVAASSSLLLNLIAQALNLYGLIDIWLARGFMVLAWIVAVSGVYFSDYLRQKSKTRTLLASVAVAVVFAGGLYLFDGYAVRRRARDAAHTAPPQFGSSASTPIYAPSKTPLPPKHTARVSIQQRGKGTGAVGGGISTGPCSNVQIGGNNNQSTINCAPPEPKLNWSPQEDENRFGKPAKKIKLSVDHSMEIPAFIARCDQPCNTDEVSLGGSGIIDWKPLTFQDSRFAGFVLMQPRPLGANVEIIWCIIPQGETPVTILAVAKQPPSLLPRDAR